MKNRISHMSTFLSACIFVACIATADAWTSSSNNRISAARQRAPKQLPVASPDMSSELSAASSSASSESSSSSTTTTATSSAKVASDIDWDWTAVAKDVFRDDSRPIVLFDGVCNLCNGGVNFAIDHDEDANLRFTSLQSRVAQSLLLRSGLDPKEANIVLVTKEKAYLSSDAVSRICMNLDSGSLKMLGQVGMVTPNWIREILYKYVSSNRYFFGENDQCRIDFDGTYTSRFVSDPTESSSSSS